MASTNARRLIDRISRVLYGLRCKCGCLWEDHTHNDLRCPWFPGMPLVTDDPLTFTLEDRMDRDAAWVHAHSRRCIFEIPERCYGSTNATICNLYISPSADPCIEYCAQHLTEGVSNG